MTRKHFAVAIIAAAMVAALASAGAALSGSTATRTLKGVVGPGYSITLKLNGKTVKRLKAGKYKIVVTDKSSIHNFTLEREKPSKPKLEKGPHVSGVHRHEDRDVDPETGQLARVLLRARGLHAPRLQGDPLAAQAAGTAVRRKGGRPLPRTTSDTCT